ncbi:MAG: preprotein translocase subunit SecG, partial [Verrucomicrobiota bacterium]|nr:preprotein translocase subunit SecG [Verrucomicrobiota bacterium]
IMELAIGILTIFLVLDALFLVLLILLQLPKKEAGLGTAFGGGTTDALFGAGAGNVLTKLTSWGAVFFLVAALVLSIMHKQVGEDRRNLGTNSAPASLPEPKKKEDAGTIKAIPSAATDNSTTTKPATAGNTNASAPTPKSETGKTSKSNTPPPAPKSKTEETAKPKAPETKKAPPAKTKKTDKADPPDKGKE